MSGTLKSKFHFFLLTVSLFALLLGALPISQVTPAKAANAGPGNAGFNYGEALQKAILFYEAQRSGHISTSSIPTRLTWRGDSQLLDGLDNGVDLSGGWVDAGDNVKFGLPLSEAVSVLAWGAVEYRSAYVASGQLQWLENQLRWVNDWFIKAHPSANVLYGQVGKGSVDHGYWAAQEVTNFSTLSGPTAAGQPTSRPSYSINPTCGGGADLAGGTAAAMAASSVVFRSDDPAYADLLLSNAQQLDAFAHAYLAVYTGCIADAKSYYQSFNGYKDELVWSDIWLAKANDAKSAGSGASYWNKAVTEYNNLNNETRESVHSYKWTLSWDDKGFGSYILMAKQYPTNPLYSGDVERWLDFWTIGVNGAKVAYTPGGHARLDQWGSFRYAANTALSAFIYSDFVSDPVKKARYKDFAEQQINYILGQNPRGCSYLMGYGNCPPLHPHHRTSHGSWNNDIDDPVNSRHILYGALSGSVGLDDSFGDAIRTYQSTEPADDYNAGLVGALAKMYNMYGGSPISDNNFPLADISHTCKDEYAAFARNMSVSANGYSISIYIENRSAWPARNLNDYKLRFFFTLDSANISDVTVTKGSSAAGVVLSGPTLWDSNNKIYYITADYTGLNIYPGGLDQHKRQVQFSISSSSTWNAANDWSWNNGAWDASYMGGWNDHQYASMIPVYQGSGFTKLCGNEPGASVILPTNTPNPSIPTNTPGAPTPTATKRGGKP